MTEENSRDRIVRGRGTLLGSVQILAASGWERSEIVKELDKVYNATTGERTYLVARFDVTCFTDEERDALAKRVCIQGDGGGEARRDADCMITLETAPEITRGP